MPLIQRDRIRCREVGPSWLGAESTPSAVDTAVTEAARDALPAGIAKQILRQNSISQCPLVKLGLHGPEQMATVPPLQQP